MSEVRLSDEDQARVDAVLHSGYNQTEKKPFRGWWLAGVLAVIVVGLGVLARGIAVSQGYLADFF
jgi:hypothetical protein